ncbi:MAG: hypothetical protein ACJAQU_000004 [Loktanella salsilacus]|jgi:hypothetical protein
MEDVKDFLEAGNQLVREQNWSDAATHWENARTAFPDAPLGYWQGIDALIRLEQFDAAWELAGVLETKMPNSFIAQFYLANLTCRRGQWEKAVKRFEGLKIKFPKREGQIQENPYHRQAVFNAKGIMEGSRALKPVVQNPGLEADENAPKKFLFVSGMPRAGTTAMGHLLNGCRDVSMFTEIYNPYRAYNRYDFAPRILEDRIQQMHNAGETRVIKRFNSETFVGDKRPLFQYSMLHTFEELSSYPVTVFHMLRDVLAVCASYSKRAQNPKDSWDTLRGLSQCIHELNMSHRLIQQMHEGFELQHNHHVVYVDYMRMFRDGPYATSVLEQAGAKFYPEKLEAFQQDSGNRKKSPIKNKDILREALHEQLDFTAARAVEEITGISLLDDLTS